MDDRPEEARLQGDTSFCPLHISTWEVQAGVLVAPPPSWLQHTRRESWFRVV